MQPLWQVGRDAPFHMLETVKNLRHELKIDKTQRLPDHGLTSQFVLNFFVLSIKIVDSRAVYLRKNCNFAIDRTDS